MLSPKSIAVIGEVYSPNSHFYDEDFNIDDYISLSGGGNEYSDLDSVYIIKGNGSVYPADSISRAGGFFRNNASFLEPGDSIIVPLKVETFSSIKATSEITQIIYQMAVAAAAVGSF